MWAIITMNRKLQINSVVEEVARLTVDALFHLHREVGPGLLESAYSACLEVELKLRRLSYAKEVPVQMNYRGRPMDLGFRADFIIENKLLLELKAVEMLLPVHRAQTITYLKITGLELGLLVNFNVPLIKEGINRVFSPTLA